MGREVGDELLIKDGLYSIRGVSVDRADVIVALSLILSSSGTEFCLRSNLGIRRSRLYVTCSVPSVGVLPLFSLMVGSAPALSRSVVV